MCKLILSLVLLLGVVPAAWAQPYSISVPNNGAGAGQLQGVPAGDYEVWASGTFGGATVTLTGRDAGATSTLATVTGAQSGATRICVGAGVAVQALVNGGTPSGLNLTLAGDGPCPGASSGGGASSVSVTNFPATQPVSGSVTSIGSNNIATNQVSVSNSATQIVTTRPARFSVTVENLGGTAIYLGGSGVTISSGILLPAGQGVTINIVTGAAIYGIVASGTASVAYLETY